MECIHISHDVLYSLSASSKSNSPLISVLLEVEMETKLMVINWEDRCNVGYYAFLKGNYIQMLRASCIINKDFYNFK